MILREALILLSVLLQCGAAFAQPRSVTGRVADVNGMPVVGATVVVKEARNSGAITDSDGRYQIRIPEGGKTLLFSFVGYQTQEQVVAPGRTRLDVVLQPSSMEIEQVVVTGYSQTTVKKVTGSVGILTADELQLKPQTSVDAMMQGELAGVTVTPTTGRPGASQRIRIRGIANLSGNTTPLWVVDGVPLQNEGPSTNLSSNELKAGGFDDIFIYGIGGVNPSDIESIVVLKDAAAAAIYGSRAANGVIVVTTKRGKAGKMKVNFSSNVTVSFRPQRQPSLMNTAEKLAWEQELWDEFAAEKYAQSLLDPSVIYPTVGIVGQVRSGQLAFSHLKGDTAAQDAYLSSLAATDTDWYDVILRNAVSVNGHVSVSGGSEAYNYYLSLGYTNDQGMLIEDSADRYTFKANLGFKPTRRFSFDVGADISCRKANTPNPSVDPFTYAYFANPYEKPYNEDGSYANDQTWLSLPNYNRDTYEDLPEKGFNILREIEGNKTKTDYVSTEVRLGMEYKLLENLKFEGLASYNFNNNDTQTTREEDTYGAYQDRLSIHRTHNGNLYGSILENKSRRTGYLLRGHLTYVGEYGDGHTLNVVGGAELRGNDSHTLFNKRFNYDPRTGNTALPPIEKPSESTLREIERLTGEYFTKSRYASFYLSADYSFRDRYILSVTGRADGSSYFGTHAQFNPNWSVGGAWILTEEPFMASARKVLQYAKLKASYGFTGNIVTSASPQLMMNYSLQTYREYQSQNHLVGTISSAPNPNLGWEKVNDVKVGLDLAFLNGRLSLETEYYRRLTKGAVDDKPLYVTTGFTHQAANFARLRNRGIEFTLRGGIVQTQDWTLDASVNFAFNSNKVLEYASSVSFQHMKLNYYEGYPARALIGGKVVGIDPLTGLYEFKLRPDAVISSDADYTDEANYLYYLGNREAPFNGGFNISAGYRNLRLSVNGVFSFGSYAYDRNESPATYSQIAAGSVSTMDRAQTEYSDLYSNHLNVWKDRTDRWTETNTTGTKYPRIYDSFDAKYHFDQSNPTSNAVVDGIYIYKISYVRIKNITLSYSLPRKVVNRGGFDAVSFNVSLANFFTFTDYKGMDPEVPGAIYPTTRSVTFGVTLGF